MIVREAWSLILIGLVFSTLLLAGSLRWDSFWLFVIATCLTVLTLFTVFFFRDPDRNIPDDPSLLVAPADGRIVAIEPVKYHPHLDGPGTRVSIFLSIIDVHVNRVPTSGVIDYVKYNPGKFFAAYQDKASELNEQTEIGMTTPDGDKIVFKQIAGIIARRIVCTLKPGDTVTAGQRCGMIRFGSRTDLIYSSNVELNVRLGDVVKGGSSPIAHWLKTAKSTAPANTGQDNVEL